MRPLQLSKNEKYFIPESGNYLDPFSMLGSASIDSVQFPIETMKNSGLGTYSRENEKFGHFCDVVSSQWTPDVVQFVEDGNQTYQKFITCV